MNQRVRVKICGITDVEAACVAASAGADAIGLVFYERSRRNLSDLGLAREIALAAGPFVSVTGLFVDADPAFVNNVLREVPLGLLQFHGEEDEAYCASFARPYIKALRMKPEVDIQLFAAGYSSATGLLLDAWRPGVPGGTGETFDWQRVPSSATLPIVLAGGLHTDNIAQAITATSPWAVDVSGGVEQSPGVKDTNKITQFVQAVRASESGRSSPVT